MKKEELLYKYFLDELSTEESEQFYALLETDSAFKAQFEFEKSVQRVVRTAERATLKDKLQGLEQDIQQPVRHKWFHRTSWRIAASVAILIAVGLYYYTSNVTADMERLYTLNYEKYPNTVYPITRGDNQDDSTERMAFVAYEASDYAGAIVLFTQLREEKQAKYIDFYLAQSYLGEGQIENAIASFKRISTNTSDFAEEARWYLALAYLKNEDKERAVQQLTAIVSEKGYKQQEALTLLEKLD
ncbi:MAG: tetratricopeptide repeat protein [Bacteroidota bacterium]